MLGRAQLSRVTAAGPAAGGSDRLELPLQSQPQGAAVGVVEEAVDGRGPETGPRGHLLGPVRAETAGWARAATADGVPGVQGRGRRLEGGHEAARVEEVAVLGAVGG